MNSKQLVSIIINCYNGDIYLKQAIDSVIAQTYKHWEIIFWDNRSSDNSKDIVSSYQDSRIKYFLSSKHTSLYSARNYAIEKSSGEFVAFLDTDDWWLPTKLERQIPFFENTDVGLVYSNFIKKNELTGKSSIAHKKSLASGNLFEHISGNYAIGLLTIVVRRSAYDQMQPKFNSKYDIIGDFDFCVRLAYKWKFACVQLPTACYRMHGNNLHISKEKEHIAELIEWMHHYNDDQIISETYGFHELKNIVNKMQLIDKAKSGNYRHALRGAFFIPGLKNKIKILIIVALPLKVFKFLTGM